MIIPETNIKLIETSLKLGEIEITGTTNNYKAVYANTLSSLCKHKNINKWAKYKPVRHTFTSSRPSDWWRGSAGNCGLSYPTFANIDLLVNSITSSTNDYIYTRPSGGTNSPYRLGDFSKYDSDAIPPIRTSPMNDFYYKSNISIGVMTYLTRPLETWLSVEDVYGALFSKQNCYFGIAMRNVGSGNLNYLTTAEPINLNGSGSINFPTSALNLGEVESWQFMCEAPHTAITDPITRNFFIPLPNCHQKFELRDSGVHIWASLMYNTNTEYISGNIIINNTFPYSITLYDSILTLRYLDNSEYDPLVRGEGVLTLDTPITINANTVLEIPINTRQYLYEFYEHGGGYSIFYANNGTYKSVDIIGSDRPVTGV